MRILSTTSEIADPADTLFRKITSAAFLATVLYAGAMIWLAPHPPMIDLPQHAGQVALLHDLLLHRSPWQSIVRINYFTPYLIGYGLALPLSFVMPIAAAFKLLLTLSYLAFVFFCRLLRKQLSPDDRLDWLFIPGFFGFAYELGFFTFLVAAPLGLLFVLLSHKYSQNPNLPQGTSLLAVVIFLFFSHGLIFIFSTLIGFSLLIFSRPLRRFSVSSLLPYVLLGILTAFYLLLARSDAVSNASTATGTIWCLGWQRLASLVVYPWGISLQYLSFAIGGVVMMIAPMAFGFHINHKQPLAFVPILVLLLVWLAAPGMAMNAALLYQRFALFTLPFYALLFSSNEKNKDGDSPVLMRQIVLYQVAIMLICWGFLALKTDQILRFASESKDFDQAMSATEPNQRVLTLIFDRNSEAAANPSAYLHYGLWYQAERGGFVDVNFAWFLPQIVRFRQDQVPAVNTDFSWIPQTFNWAQHHGEIYRYFLVRHSGQLPVNLFESTGRCQVTLLKSAGTWSVYETQHCTSSAPRPSLDK